MNNNKHNRHTSAKIGLFGGTFNPFHQGHLQVAQDVLQQFLLDTIHFIPCALPPHKATGSLATAAQRLEMVRLAVADRPAFVVSDVEIQRQGPSYTWDTLQYYKSALASDVHLYFMVGLDAFLEIHTWKLYRRLFDEVAFIVMSRPGVTTAEDDIRDTVLGFARELISPDYQRVEGPNMIQHPDKPPIHLASVTPVDIASSQIRHMIRTNEAIAQWVASPVARFIEEKGLYR